MDDNERPGLLSQLIPDEIEKKLGLGQNSPQDQDSQLASTLRTLIGPNSGPVGSAVSEFLEGKGTLLETTRGALTRGPKTAEREVADFLEKTFNLNDTTARIVASILIRLFPAIGKLAGGTTDGKTKPRRRKKASSSSKPKAKKRKTTSSSAKPKKRKTTPSKPRAKKSTRAGPLD